MKIEVGCIVFTVFLELFTFAFVLHAQDLLPELAEPAAKYKTAIDELENLRSNACARAGQSYISALNSVEKSAIASGQIELVAAVDKERDAVAAGTFGPDLPSALTKNLQSTRKAFLASMKRVDIEYARRRKQTDAGYLRTLAMLQTKAVANSELAKQLAEEKAKLLENGAASRAEFETARVLRGKNVVMNGDFNRGDGNKISGWVSDGHAKVETENGNKFVRIDEKAVNGDGTTGYIEIISQEISVPKGAEGVTLSVKLRVRDFANLSKLAPKTPGATIALINHEGKSLLYVTVGWSGSSGVWKTVQKKDLVPKDAVKARVWVTTGFCPGQIDIDDVEVTFN